MDKRALGDGLDEENLGAADLALTPDDVTELDEASAAIEVRGERYPEQMQRMIDR